MDHTNYLQVAIKTHSSSTLNKSEKNKQTKKSTKVKKSEKSTMPMSFGATACEYSVLSVVSLTESALDESLCVTENKPAKKSTKGKKSEKATMPMTFGAVACEYDVTEHNMCNT